MNGNKGFETPNWVPLETKLRETGRPIGLCAAFMWMWRDRGIEFYKHIDTRRVFVARFPVPVLAAARPGARACRFRERVLSSDGSGYGEH